MQLALSSNTWSLALFLFPDRPARHNIMKVLFVRSKWEQYNIQHTHQKDNQTARQSSRRYISFVAGGGVRLCSSVNVIGDRVLERRYPGARSVLEMAKQLLSSRSSRRRLAPTLSYQPPQRVGEAQRLGIIRFPWAVPFLYSNYHCVTAEVMKRSETGENLAAGKCKMIVMSATSSPRRQPFRAHSSLTGGLTDCSDRTKVRGSSKEPFPQMIRQSKRGELC